MQWLENCPQVKKRKINENQQKKKIDMNLLNFAKILWLIVITSCECTLPSVWTIWQVVSDYLAPLVIQVSRPSTRYDVNICFDLYDGHIPRAHAFAELCIGYRDVPERCRHQPKVDDYVGRAVYTVLQTIIRNSIKWWFVWNLINVNLSLATTELRVIFYPRGFTVHQIAWACFIENQFRFCIIS